MSVWRRVRLGDITELVTKGTTPSDKDGGFSSSGVNYIKSDAVSYQGRIDTSKFVYISNDVHEKFKRSQLKADDILFSMAGAFLGKTGIVEERMLPANTNQALAIIRLDKRKAQPRFVGYFLRQNSTIELVNNMSGQSAQPNINFQEIKSIEIDLPPIEEQEAIAVVLADLDNKIDLLHRQNKTLEAMAETLFRQWFVEGAGDDWEVAKVSDLVNVLSGYAFKSSTFRHDGKYRLITIKAVQDGYLQSAGADRIEDVPQQMPLYCHLDHGDILLSLTGNVGRCCMVDEKHLVLNQRVAKLQARNERDWAFVYAMFRQASMRSILEEKAKGTAQANLSPVEMANMDISLPPENALEAYSVQVTPLIKKVLFNKGHMKVLEQIRDTLLPKLMSGEVRVQYESTAALEGTDTKTKGRADSVCA